MHMTIILLYTCLYLYSMDAQHCILLHIVDFWISSEFCCKMVVIRTFKMM